MKITVELSPEEFKELWTPGEKQIEAVAKTQREMSTAFMEAFKDAWSLYPPFSKKD